MLDTLETAGQDLDQAHAKIEAVREMLQAVQVDELAPLIARLERIAAEVARAEVVVFDRSVAGAIAGR